MMRSPNNNLRLFTKEGKTAEILNEVIASIPVKTKVYLVGGAARNTIYFDLFNKPLPQRDYDILLVGNLQRFIDNLRKDHKFIYGKIRRKDEIVLKKKLVPKPQSITDYIVLDIHRSHEKNILKNLEKNSAFTINGFAIPLQHYFSKNFKKYLVELPGAVNDLKNHRLILNISGYKGHPGNLFACLRFMSIGFTPPDKNGVALLLKQLPKLEKWRFERSIKKVFGYTGGEKRARQLAKNLGVKIDIFNFEGLKEFAAKSKIIDRQRKTLNRPFRSGSRLSVGQARRGGRKGGVGGIPPADLPAEVSTQAGPSQFGSDIFKQTPHFIQIPVWGGGCLGAKRLGMVFSRYFYRMPVSQEISTFKI